MNYAVHIASACTDLDKISELKVLTVGIKVIPWGCAEIENESIMVLELSTILKWKWISHCKYWCSACSVT